MRTLGYSTCAIGKWHLGGKPEYSPLKRGFDEFYGTLANTPYYHPTNFVDSRVSPDVERISDDDFYTTDQYAARAVDWLGKQQDRAWFLYFPFNAQHAPLQAPQKYLDRFPNIADENRRTFAAIMSAMDDTVGRVLEKVRNGVRKKTRLSFSSPIMAGRPLRPHRATDPCVGSKPRPGKGACGFLFARSGKEARFRAGKTYENPIIQLDLLPTCVTAAGGTVETNWQLDGVNLLPYLKGENAGKPHETLYWRFGEQWAIRHGDWKLVVGRGINQPGLFNLADDLAEANDLSDKQPEKVQELRSLWQAWNAEQAPPSSPQEKPNKANKRQAKRRAAKA